MKYLYIFLCLLLLSSSLQAQSSKDYAVLVSATVSKTAPVVTLKWPLDAGSTGYKIWRKAKTDATWGTMLKSLPGTAVSYADMTAVAGTAYEYRVEKTASANGTSYTGFGYLYAGADVPAIENRDKIILLIDSHFADTLATEIQRLKMDLLGDGWQVISHTVKRTDKVTDVKKIIMADYNADPTHVKTLFLLGHVPVPYSGDYAPDHHFPDHVGAWPADVYYGAMEEKLWTDYLVENNGASRTENHNVAGDGKFDNDLIPSDVKLQIGRVDFSNLPAFKRTESELMRRYLDKDHNWRVKNYTAKEQGVIEDNFGGMGGEAFAATAFYNFSAMFGDTNVFVKDYLKSVTGDTFLWSYGCGGGSYTSAGGIASTSDFVSKKSNTVFTMLFGSYFGDWDSKDNILRAPLAGDNMTLTNVWAGRPHWNFHHMALGENIGYSTLLTQNDYKNYFRVLNEYFAIIENTGDRLVTPALMGDPTLRMHVVAPPQIKDVAANKSSVALEWSASKDAEEYYVYRTDNLTKPFVRIGKTNAAKMTYQDDDPSKKDGKYYYMVRAAKLQHSGSGTYYNLSQGSIDSVGIAASIKEQKLVTSLHVYPNPSQSGKFMVQLAGEKNVIYTVQVADITGRVVYMSDVKTKDLENGKFTIDLDNAAKGIYTLQISNAATAFTQKIVYR